MEHVTPSTYSQPTVNSEEELSNHSRQFNYSWVIAFTGVLVIFICQGLARLSLGMLLPSMSASFDWSYSQMGLIGTANFTGYFVCVILVNRIARKMGARWTVTIGLILISLSMVFISRAAGFTEILCLYTFTGIGSALANVPMLGLVSHWFSRKKRGKAAGIMMSGCGIAIVFTGFFIPWLNATSDTIGWRISWLVMGIISIVVAIWSAYAIRNNPVQQPSSLTEEIRVSNRNITTGTQEKSYEIRSIMHLGSLFFIYGMTYSTYATFIVSELVNERGFDEALAGTFWAVIGALSVMSGPLFGSLSDKLGRKTGFMFVHGLFAIAYALAAFHLPDLFLYLSIFIVGITLWGMPSIISASVGDYFKPHKTVKALSLIILFFGVGQITGPAVAGYIADTAGTFKLSFGLCSLASLLAVIIAVFLRPPERLSAHRLINTP